MNDISERKALEEQIMHQATHDALTDLPNRLLLEDRLRQLPFYTATHETVTAILFLDLDRFKNINDSLGHKVGDDVIKAIALRLQQIVRKTDTIARIGGDEFIIILMQMRKIEEIEDLSQKILESIRQPVKLMGHELNLTGSIGITLYPHDGEEPNELLRNADTAMYHAKESGRDNFKFYHQQMNKRVSKVLMIENDLYKAIEQNQFELYYQPIIDIKTRHIVCLEALIRWNHPQLGLVPPNDFIYIAEEIGLISRLGEWTLDTACKQTMSWIAMGLPQIQVSVNISARQLRHSNRILNYVKKCLERTHMPPKLLALELTEGLFIDHSEEMQKLLLGFKNIGVSLFIDDFGVGYSTLNYLRSFPIDKVKIDRTFISNIADDKDNMAIVNAIIAMTKTLGLKVLAEGVETQAELDFLLQHNCDEVQGYYFSKPLTVQDCTLLIKENFGLFGEK
jgi:diguanylate cyclase (GGDEF)-like protein